MGKNKKEFIEPNREVNQQEKEEVNKTRNDNHSKNEKNPEKKFTNKFNFDFYRLEEKFNNKFDILFSNKKYINNVYNPRKESKDSTNDSFSWEDYHEESNYTNKNTSKNSLNLQNKTDKKQGQFKSTAADFKIKYKTELCKYYEINGFCKYGDKCAYAHGKENLRSKITNSSAYRTRKCEMVIVPMEVDVNLLINYQLIL